MPLRRPVSEDVEVRYRVAALILLVATFALASSSLVEAQEVHDLERRGLVTDATVVDVPFDRSKSSSFELQFTTSSGRTVRATTGRIDGDRQLGDRVKVRYDPERPDRVQEADWGADYSASLAFGIPALITVALWLGCTLRRWPSRLERPLFA